MEKQAHEQNGTLSAAMKAAIRSSDASDVADVIGALGRDEWYGLLADWKSSYLNLSAEIRKHRHLSKRGDDKSTHQAYRQARRKDARRMMLVRSAMKELARRHWAARFADAA